MEKMSLKIQMFGDSNTPNVSDLATLWYSDTKTGEKTQICHVQSIPQLREPKTNIEYDALDYETARQRKGSRPNSVKQINVYYTEEQSKLLEEMSEDDESYWFFVKYPDATIVSESGAKVYYFQAQIDMSNEALTKGEMIQDVMSLFINTEVEYSFGFPTA